MILELPFDQDALHMDLPTITYHNTQRTQEKT